MSDSYHDGLFYFHLYREMGFTPSLVTMGLDPPLIYTTAMFITIMYLNPTPLHVGNVSLSDIIGLCKEF